MCSHLVPRLFTRHQLAGYLRNGKKIRDPMRQLQSCLFGSEPAGAANLNDFPLMEVDPEVAEALAHDRPVVALETTIVTHGMPYPDNLRTALSVEEVVRSNGVTPATIGVVDGKICIGLSREKLEMLASPATSVLKLSRRDLAMAMSQRLSGGTTAAATMLCAHRAGIRVFATGGVGGVHRGGETSMDVSADLVELGRTPVAVVSAGVKNILDIPRTLEVLETQGVTVISYGSSLEFPSFYTPHSGVNVEYCLESPRDCARLIKANLSLQLGSGILIAVPIPEEAAPHGEEVENSVQQALSEASEQGIVGRHVTPFILKRVNELTGGKSLLANIALIKHNAKIGSLIAAELSQLSCESETEDSRKRVSKRQRCSAVQVKDGLQSENQNKPVVIGSCALDITAKAKLSHINSEDTSVGTLTQSHGGVGRNIAEVMARMGSSPFFVSAVGTDDSGSVLTDHLNKLDVDTTGVQVLDGVSTASFCVVLNGDGDTHCLIGDTVANDHITVEWVSRFEHVLRRAPLVCLDGNSSVATIHHVLRICSDAGVPIWYEPTCLSKATRPFLSGSNCFPTYLSPNLSELRAIYYQVTGEAVSTTHIADIVKDEKIDEVFHLSRRLLPLVPHLLVSLGKDGMAYICQEDSRGVLYPPAPEEMLPVDVISVTGAGDSLAGTIMSGLIQGHSMDTAIKAGLRAAYYSLLSTRAVSPVLSPAMFSHDEMKQWQLCTHPLMR